MSKISITEKIFVLAIAIYLLSYCLHAFVVMLTSSQTDYQEDSRHYHQKLLDILKEPDEVKKRDALHELAIEVGAGAEHTVQGTPYRVDEHLTMKPFTIISESEIVNNINNALQTKSTMSAQEQAEKSNLIAVFALLVAMGSGLVAMGSGLLSFSAKRATSRIKKEKPAQ